MNSTQKQQTINSITLFIGFTYFCTFYTFYKLFTPSVLTVLQTARNQYGDTAFQTHSLTRNANPSQNGENQANLKHFAKYFENY